MKSILSLLRGANIQVVDNKVALSDLDRVIEIIAAKQVGTIYHFTPVGQLVNMAKHHFQLYSNRKADKSTPYEGMGAYSFTRNPRLKFNAGDSEEDKWTTFDCNARIVVDGDKLSSKYQVFPYSDLNNPNSNKGPARTERGGESEETVIVEDGEKLDLKKFIIRVDIYDDPKIPNYNAKWIPQATKALDSLGIPWKMVNKF